MHNRYWKPQRLSSLDRYRRFNDRALLLIALAALTISLSSQAATDTPVKSNPVAPEPKGAVKDDEMITLSPFEVSADKDKGFMAVNAGTATKLALDLRDMPAAYSVMTGEFIETLEIRNLEAATSWTTAGAIAAVDGTPNDTLSTPNRVFTQQRGMLNQTGQQKNFFLNGGIGDTYNIERIDFGRGPNALFFNFGDINNPFAGGTSMLTKAARLDKSSEQIRMTVGSWDNYRSTFDVNHTLNPKAAVRVMGIWQDVGGYRLNARDDRAGLTLAGIYRFTPKTELKVSASSDHFERSQTHAEIFDNLSGWDGVTTSRGFINNSMLGSRPSTGGTAVAGTAMSNGKVLSAGGEVQGIARFNSAQNVFVPGAGIMNWQNLAVTRRADETAYTPAFFNGQTYSRNDIWMRDIAQNSFVSGQITPDNLLGMGFGAGNGGTALLYQPDLPDDRFKRAISGSAALGGDFLSIPGKRITLTPHKKPVMVENDRNANAMLTHKFSDSLFFSLAADVNAVNSRIFTAGFNNRLRYAYIDINELLPNGAPNPHLGDVYSDDVVPSYRKYTVKNQGIRPSLNYLLDLKKWGYYTFNLGAAMTQRKIIDRFYGLSLANTTDARLWNGPATILKVREYWSDIIAPIDSWAPTSYYNTSFDSQNNLTGSTVSQVSPKFTLTGASDYNETARGAAFAVSGRYFHSERMDADRLVVTAGIGINNMTTVRYDMMNRADLSTGWNGYDVVFKPNAPSDWATLTYLPRTTAGVPTSTIARVAAVRPRNTASLDPIGGLSTVAAGYESERFRDDYNLPKRDVNIKNFSTGFVYRPLRWADVKLNYSNSYVPPVVGTLDLEGLPAKVTEAYGYDARIGLSPFGERFILNSGFFYNFSKNTRIASAIQNQVNALYATRDYTDFNTNNRNSLGLPDLVNNTNFDYQSIVNMGYEFEMVGRIKKGLEVTGSYARFRNKPSDRYPLTPGYLATRQNDILEVLKRAGGMLDSTGLAVRNTTLGITDSAQLANQTNAVNAYNNMTAAYATSITNRVGEGVYTDWSQTFNTFVRYEFQSGPLQRLKIGVGANWKSEVYLGGTDYRANVVANPNYDKTKPFNNAVGSTFDSNGHYVLPAAYNAPWMPDPSIDQRELAANQAKSPSLLNSVVTIGYSHRLRSKWRVFDGHNVTYNLVVNNVLNRHRIERVNYTLRAPGGDYMNNQNVRTAEAGTISGFQEPISFSFTTTIDL